MTKLEREASQVKHEAVVIGSSAGGTKALWTILPELPENYPLAIIIVQHLSPDSDSSTAAALNEVCKVEVKEACENETIKSGVAYLAPANYHLLVEKDKTLSLTVDERVNYSRPAIDVLFETAADAYREKLVGVILTGASADGSLGLKAVKDKGGLTIVQDPRTAKSKIMPEAAICATVVDHILPLSEIGLFLKNLPRTIHKRS